MGKTNPRALLICFCLPLIIFFVVSALVPHERVDGPGGIDPSGYLWMTATRVVLMAVAFSLFAKILLREFPLRCDLWGLIVGVIGGFLWIVICALAIEEKLFSAVGFPEWLMPAREGVDPFVVYPDSTGRATFLFFRISLLAVCVPIAEELFLRGFFMRAVESGDWETLPLKNIGRAGLIAGSIYGVLTHPSEFIAAAVWFSLVSWMMVKTGKFWNCVLAHAITNAMLGVYILSTGNWKLW